MQRFVYLGKDKSASFPQHGTSARAGSQLYLPCRICAAVAHEPEFPALVDGANRQRNRRLVLFAGDLQPAVAIDGTRKLGGTGAGASSLAADICRASSRGH